MPEDPAVSAYLRALPAGEALAYPPHADLSPPVDGDVRVVKAIVAGLGDETASYARIGSRAPRRTVRREDGLVGT